MAFTFIGENEVAGANSYILDPLSPVGNPAKQVGVWAETVSFIDAAGAVANHGVVYIAPYAVQLIGFQLIYGVASSSGTVTVEKLTGTTAPGSGTALLTGTVTTSTTANTVKPGTLIATLSSLQLATGDRFGLVFAGTQTGLVGLAVSLLLQKV